MKKHGGRNGQALHFTRLQLENWRNFRSVDVSLNRRVFLVGPNASGKSNFLDAFRFLRELVSVGGGLRAAVERRQGVTRIRCLSARQYPDIVLQAELGSGGSSISWRYELHLSQDNRAVPMIKKECVVRNGRVVLDRPDDQDQSDPARLTQTHLEQVNVNKEFREVAEFFGTVRYMHIVPQLIREPERSVGRQNDPYGGDFLEQIVSTPVKTRKARLRRIREALRVAVPQLSEIEDYRDSHGTPHLRGKYAHWRPQGAWQDEGQFSDGTLRLLGLLWAVLDGWGPLLLEEPELSLHADVVRFLPQMFARLQRRTGRQIFVSTHSPDLLRDDGIGLDEVLLLRPDAEGTVVKPASEIQEAKVLLEGGSSLAEVVVPHTRPTGVNQLTLWPDA